LNGDGTGLPFGVNEGILGWAIFGVFTLIWVNWFNAQKDCECHALTRDLACA
jgi:photosystem II PsbW protein